jgi:hypothetical protein
VGTVMYALQWLCALVVLWRIGRSSQANTRATA